MSDDDFSDTAIGDYVWISKARVGKLVRVERNSFP